jgi:CBS domain containing-hemolysin-like protein
MLLLAYFSVSKLFDQYGEQYTDEGFQRSIVAFAIAKTLNGAISVVQGTEVAVEPAGIGLILTPGQILDPVNDLIERFSWVMLVCTTSLGIQSVLLTIFSSSSFSLVVALSLLLLILFVWKQPATSVVLKNVLYRVAAFLIILRFFIPLMAITSDGLYKAFLEPTYQESRQQLEQSNTAIANMSKDNQQISSERQDLSWLELLNNSIDSAIDSIDVDKQLDRLKAEADNLTNHIIDLIVVFTMQTILFPLIFIWLAMKLIKANFSFHFV